MTPRSTLAAPTLFGPTRADPMLAAATTQALLATPALLTAGRLTLAPPSTQAATTEARCRA
jgi:hypothetical protein